MDWAKFCYDVDHENFGLGNEFLNVRWTFSKSGTYIQLNGENNDKLEIVVNDDLSGLVNHRFLVQGYIEETEANTTMNNTIGLIMIGLGFLFFVLYKKNKLFGGIGFMVIGLSLFPFAEITTDYVIAMTVFFGALINILFDLFSNNYTGRPK